MQKCIHGILIQNTRSYSRLTDNSGKIVKPSQIFKLQLYFGYNFSYCIIIVKTWAYFTLYSNRDLKTGLSLSFAPSCVFNAWCICHSLKLLTCVPGTKLASTYFALYNSSLYIFSCSFRYSTGTFDIAIILGVDSSLFGVWPSVFLDSYNSYTRNLSCAFGSLMKTA